MQSKGKRGGARPGAGRKPSKLNVPFTNDPLEFLLAVMSDEAAPTHWRVAAAKTALAHMRLPLARGGLKAARQEAAARASKGFFAPQRAPVIVRMADYKEKKP